MNTTTMKHYTLQELRRIWNIQQRQIAKEGITKTERRKTTITDHEFLVKLAQQGYVLRYRDVRFWVDEETGWSILDTSKRYIYNAALSDMFAAIRKMYGVEPEKLGV